LCLGFTDGSVKMMRKIVILVCFSVVLWSAQTPLWAAHKTDKEVRLPAVAGTFYPDDAQELRKMIGRMLRDSGGVNVPGKVRGLVAPHAGYIYSGSVAAAGYRQIDPSTRRVILLGSSHRVPLQAASIPDVKAYRTPLGDIRLAALASSLRKAPGFESVPQAHVEEHSLEVQLPFLQVALESFEIVPILTNRSDSETLARALAPHIDEDTLVVASTDLSHYHSYETANSLDRLCTTAIPACKFSDLPLCEACGKKAVETLMHLSRIKGWEGMLVDYKNSGDTAGNKDRVVGYATIAFTRGKEMTEKMNGTISIEDRAAILKLARSAIEAKLVEGRQVLKPTHASPTLNELRGCFVTLHKQGRLRGCIGTIEPLYPLVEGVEKNAQNAAFRDPRFKPVSAEELEEIDIEVSVLTVPEEISFRDGEDLKRKLSPNVHGVILSRGTHRSTFLPQVWAQLPEKDQFLERLCLKGGMPAEAWHDPETKVQVYQAEVFGEKSAE
jgi:AmmeMemoRadiSam system protein B/AmmeMemoRadiSam system protein A